MEKLFITATREGYRFETEIGNLTVEQLWDLPIKHQRSNVVSLATIAQHLNSKLQPVQGLEWLDTDTKQNTEQTLIQNKLAIIRYIVETRWAEAQARQEAEGKLQLLAKLKAEQARRKEQQVMEQSDEELAKLIAELEQK